MGTIFPESPWYHNYYPVGSPEYKPYRTLTVEYGYYKMYTWRGTDLNRYDLSTQLDQVIGAYNDPLSITLETGNVYY